MNIEIKDISGGIMLVELDGELLASDERGMMCSRQVYLFDEFVVKLDQEQDWKGEGKSPYLSNNQTASEIEFYETIEAGDEEFFAPMLAWGLYGDEFFIVQERVRAEEFFEAKDFEVAQVNLVIRKYKLNNDVWFDCDQFTKSYKNCAYTATGVKIYDVGYTKIHAEIDRILSEDKNMYKNFYEVNDKLEGEKADILRDAYLREQEIERGKLPELTVKFFERKAKLNPSGGMDVNRCIECGDEFDETAGDSINFCTSTCKNEFYAGVK